MKQWPSNCELQEARNCIMSEVIDQIRSYDLSVETTVMRIHHLLMIVEEIDQFCED